MAELRQYLAALHTDPDDVQAWAGLRAALQAGGASAFESPDASGFAETREWLRDRGELDAAARLFDLELEGVVDPERRADLLRDKGFLYADDLLDEAGALECFTQVLALRPDDQDAAQTLAELAMIRDNWEKFVAKYLDEAAASTDRALTTRMYQSAAEHYARYQPEADEVELYLGKALEVDPRNRKAAVHLARRLRAGERWDELAAFLQGRVDAAATKEDRVHALLALAELAADQLARPDLAEGCMAQVIALDPANPRALRMLASAHEAREDWQALVGLYASALKARRRGPAPDSEVGVLLQIAMLHWKRLDNPEDAEEYFRRLRKHEPAHPAALDFYRAYYPARGETAKLVQVLRQAQKSLDPARDGGRRRRISIEIAEVAETELGNPEKAIDAWKSILRADGDGPDAQQARAALKRLYRKTEKWNALLDMIKEEIGKLPADDAEGRVAGLMDIVEIYRDRLKLDVMVINTYNSILKLDPHNRRALDDLADKYHKLKRWNDLISVLSRRAELPELPVAERVELYREVAGLWSERFGNYAQAVVPLESLLALAPDDADALARLKEIYQRRRQWRPLIALLGREADRLGPVERAGVLVEMARLAAERLGDNRLAIELWNRVLELAASTGMSQGGDGSGAPAGEGSGDRHDAAAGDTAGDPTDQALDALAGIYEREKRFLALAEVYHRQWSRERSRVAAGEDPGRAVAILERLGALHADRLGAPLLAAEVFRDILALRPGHSRALRTLRELYAVGGDFAALEGLYAELGQWDELCEAFHAIADRLDDKAEKLRLLERTAAIAAERFDKPEKVARAYERVLSVQPNHLGAARALVPIYQQAQKWARLLNTYEILLDHADDRAEKLDLHIKIRDLCEHRLGSKALAFQWTTRAFRIDPRAESLLADLERLGAETDEWERVAQLLDERLGDDDLDDGDRLRVLRELGKIAQQRLHEPERARDYQRRVLALAPDDPAAMAALEEIAGQLSEWPDLLRVHRRRAELEQDLGARVELLYKIAFIEEERLADLDAAAATYQAILDALAAGDAALDADDSLGAARRALDALAKIQEARGDWEGLTLVLERKLAHTADTATRIALLLRIGGLCERSLDRPVDALARYKEALALAPDAAAADGVHAALERFLGEEDDDGGDGDDDLSYPGLGLPVVSIEHRVEVARLLLPAFEDRGDSGRVARALEILREVATPVEAMGYDRRLVSLYGQRLGDARRAYRAALRVLAADPEDAQNRGALARYADELGASEDLAAHLEQVLEASGGVAPGSRRQLAAELARLYEQRIDAPDRAEAAWRRVLDIDEADDDAYEALDRLYRAAGRWTDLRDLLARREEHTADADRRKAIVLAVCDLEEGVLDNPEGAIAAYRRALDIDPGLVRAYKALERLHAQREEWDELEALLGRALDHATGEPEQVQLMYRRAELRARRTGRPDGAVDLLEDLLPVRELRLRVARILEPLYEADERWHDLCLVLEAQREYAASPPEAAALLARAAQIREDEMEDVRGAFDAWLEALAVDPHDERARGAILRLAGLLDLWSEAAEAYERAIGAADPGDIALGSELLGELARIYDVYLADPERATVTYRRLLDIDPGNPDTVRRAAVALDRLYDEEERWGELVDIVRRQADWADTPEERKALLSRIAQISEDRLEDADSAIATWREVLGEDPEDARAVDALERLHAAGGRHAELVDILRRRVELAADASVRKVHLLRIADLWERALGEPDEAITAYLEVLDALPDDADTLVELARLYRDKERWADLLDIAERRLTATDDRDERRGLMFEVASLLHHHLHREREALEQYAEVLADDPGGDGHEVYDGALAAVESMLDDEDLRLRTAEILQPIYKIRAEHDKLADLLLRVADISLDPREQLRCLREVVRIREHALEDGAGAFDVAVRALRAGLAEPELPELIGEVERLASELGREGELIDIYREIAPDVLDGELQRRLYLDVADLARAVRDDADLAREFYQRVLDAQPDDMRALGALESIYRLAEEHDSLYDILIRKAELAGGDLDVQAAALSEAARLCTDHLDRPEDAVVAWEQVLEILPDSREAADALERLYDQSERWHDLVDLLERRLGFAYSVTEAVSLRYRLGQLHEHNLLDPEAAVENYSAALGGDETHVGAIAALERFLDEPGTRNQAADVLEQIYVRRQEWSKLVLIYEIKLEAADEPAERLALTRHIARLYEDQLEDLDGAFRWHGRVFREIPGDEAVRDQLTRLAAVLDNWHGLANVYAEYLDDEPGDTIETATVARALGDICDERTGEIERGHAAYRRVLAFDPGDLDTFARLEAMLTRGERWYALIDVYEDASAASVDDARRIELFSRMAQVYEKHLRAPNQAIDAYRSVRDIDPDNARAADQLDRLYRQHGQWFELSELLSARIDRAPDAYTHNELRMRLAEVLETRLDDVAGAVDQYELVLAADEHWEQALAPLERLVLNEDFRERIAELLEPIYRASDWWQKLVVILDAKVEYVDDAARRVDMLREIAEIHETRGGDPWLALSALSRAWRENVRDGQVYDELSALASRLGAWDELVATLEQGVADEYDAELVSSVLGRVADIHEGQRRDDAAAIAAWQRVLEVADDDQLALMSLDRLMASQERWQDLVRVLERRAELAAEDHTRLVMLHRIAAIHEDKLEAAPDAIAAYKNVLATAGDDARALDALERLYRDQGDWHELVAIVGRKIDLADTPSDRRALRLTASATYEHQLGDAYEAIAQLVAVVAEHPQDAEALIHLDRLYAREGMWAELVDILDRRAELEPDTRNRAELLFRAAQVVETELLDPDAAIARYAGVLDVDFYHVGARAALDAMTQSEDTMARAAAVLEGVYRRESAYDRMAQLYERRLAARGDGPEARLRDYTALAEIHEAYLGDLDAAFGVWARALAEMPADATAQGQLDRLAGARGSWEEFAELLEERLRELIDAELEYAYATRLAQIYEEALGDLDRAAAKHRQALETMLDERGSLAALDRIYGRAGRYQELAEILAREADATADEAERAQQLFRLGDLREVALSDVAGAVAAYRDVLEVMPGHPAARTALERLLLSAPEQRADIIDILEPLYDGEGDFARLAELLEAKLLVTADPIDRAGIYSRIADIAETRLSDPVRALDAAGWWLAEDPQSEQALGELERLADIVNRWSEVAARLSGIVASAEADHVRRPLLYKLGLVQLDRLGDAERAEASLRDVLALDPESMPTLTALRRLHATRGDLRELADVLWRMAELSYDADAKRAHLVEAASLREQLGDLDGAIAAWREALALDESDREAHAHLAGLYEHRGQWPELIDVLTVAARHAADAGEERALRTRIATIHTAVSEDLDLAVEAWQAVLDVEPTAMDALRALEEVHTRREDWLAVQDVLVRRLDILDDDASRVEVYRELAQLAETRRDDPDDAIVSLYQVLDIDGAHAATYDDLERLLRRTERWQDLVELLERAADALGRRGQAGDAEREVRSLTAAADVWEAQLANPGAAAEILERVLQRQPGAVAALTRLAKIYEDDGDWERCGATLERALAQGPSGRDAAELYFRLGAVARERDGEVDAALGHWTQALAHDAGYTPAIVAIEDIARDRQEWQTVAEMVRRREMACQDPEQRLELTLELAELYGGKLDQPNQVIPLLERAAQLAPDDPRVQSPLADMYFTAGRYDEAAPIYEALADRAKKERKMRDVARYRQRAGGIFEARGDTDRALASYEEAFRVNPTDVATMAGLGRIYLAREMWEKARRVYRSMVLQNLDEDAGVTKAEVYYHLGRIHLQLGEDRKAKGMFQRGLELEPDNEALRQALAGL